MRGEQGRAESSRRKLKGRPSTRAAFLIRRFAVLRGSGELAPEVGIFNHNCFGPWLVSPTRSMTRVRCNIPGRGFVPRTGTEIPEQLLPLSMWPLGRGGPSVAEKGDPNENACFSPAACGRSHGVSCACGF